MKRREKISLRWQDYIDDDRILIDWQTDAMMRITGVTVEDLRLSQAIVAHLQGLQDRARAGEAISSEKMYAELNDIAEAHGCEYGMPIPLAAKQQRQNHLVMAHGVPLQQIVSINQDYEAQQQRLARIQQGPQEAAMELINSGYIVRNSWHVVGDQTVCVIEVEGKPMAWPQYGAVQRLAKLTNTICTRMDSHMSVDAEMKARDALRAKINDAQWRCYVLNDCFFERSPRSGLHYLFRKGYPTIALSHHGEGNDGGRAIAALCLHPMGFYQYTHAGLMTPTDEVICHLLMMRADEHKFWAKSGQWRVTDTRSGI